METITVVPRWKVLYRGMEASGGVLSFDRLKCRHVEVTLRRWERMRPAALEYKYFPSDC